MPPPPARKSWQRATKFREHLSFISTTPPSPASQYTVNESRFSPTTPPPMPKIPERPMFPPTWSRSSIERDIEAGPTLRDEYYPSVQPKPSVWSRISSIWRSARTQDESSSLRLPPLTPWRALSIKKRTPPKELIACRCAGKCNQKKSGSRIWLILLIIILLYLLGSNVFLNVKVLSPTFTPPPVTSSVNSSPPAPTSSTTPPDPALVNCLSQFTVNAPTSPSSFPCSTCVPILSSVPNDLSSNTTNPQTTGQGNALQFCALRDIAAATSGNVLQNAGWLKDTKFCQWAGVSCDEKGRINMLQLSFPGVPAQLSDGMANLVGLKVLQIIGNGQVPAGNIPAGLLALPTLSNLHLESTAFAGPLSDDAFAKTTGLTSVTLVKNAKLGGSLPSSLLTLPLTNLIVNGQSLSMPLASIIMTPLAPSLAVLDLSSNSLTGTLPSTISSFTTLQELHLDNNNLLALPLDLPTNLKVLSLSNNPQLAGTVPNAVCANTALTCDLRGTGLTATGGATSCGQCVFGQISTQSQ